MIVKLYDSDSNNSKKLRLFQMKKHIFISIRFGQINVFGWEILYDFNNYYRMEYLHVHG